MMADGNVDRNFDEKNRGTLLKKLVTGIKKLLDSSKKWHLPVAHELWKEKTGLTDTSISIAKFGTEPVSGYDDMKIFTSKPDFGYILIKPDLTEVPQDAPP
jgi:hypothetical protein